MSAINEKTPAVTTANVADPNPHVLTITRPSAVRQASGNGIAVMSTIDDIDSSHTISPAHSVRNEKSMDVENPYYNHNTESKQNITMMDTRDIEAQNLTQLNSQACLSKTGLLKKTRCDPAWPDRQELKMRKKALKRDQACCAAWAGMSKKKRSIITTVIVLVILGAAIGIGFGISRHVGGGAVTTKGTNTPLPG